MPHFSFSGKFSLNPPSVPHFSVSWYKKAMDNGMVLNSPTIFGAKGNTLLAGGEAGAEAVVGVGSLETMIREAVAAAENTSIEITDVVRFETGEGIEKAEEDFAAEVAAQLK